MQRGLRHTRAQEAIRLKQRAIIGSFRFHRRPLRMICKITLQTGVQGRGSGFLEIIVERVKDMLLGFELLQGSQFGRRCV